ncbi:hypothetical protein QBC47DRAFT_368043 [Echria macrotheca]|uniref:Zn(2)-C6 fungal-type domain-containing protein n=1 Tax=Echria macrotheca TaxID=438768 RepID=A0AAJ0BRK7_9PEZI|nr:hypothetical protein QBC47DRAFT_368043 [Echria macrotheca]
MAEQLKRTFHGKFPPYLRAPTFHTTSRRAGKSYRQGNKTLRGENRTDRRTFIPFSPGCLTCRKRKVRCHGGNPCQNCSRMNITCHSSFETNLRIRVSTPNGQKVVETKHTAKRTAEAPRQQQQHQQQAQRSNPHQPPQLLGTPSGYGGRNDPYVTTFQPQFSSFSFAQPPTTTYASEPPTLQLTPPSSLGNVVQDLDPGQFNGVWGAFDFGAIDPDLGRDFGPRVDVGGMHAPVTLPPMFEQYLPTTPPVSNHGYAISDSEGSTSSNGQLREGPKEWVPRRRKRSRKEPSPADVAKGRSTTGAGVGAVVAPASASASSAQQRRMVDEANLYEHFRNCTQDDFINEQDTKWSFNRFVPDFVQKCSPHSPMRLAVLAWTAKHSAIEDGAPVDPTAVGWYNQSSEQVEKLFNLPDPNLELGNLLPVTNAAEVIIATSFFLNRYDVLSGDLSLANSRLERMTRWLSKNTAALSLSPFVSKLLLWACYLQIRISIFSRDYLRFPTLLDVLGGRTDYHLILEQSHNFYLDMFGSSYPQERLAEDVERIPAALHLHETFRLLNNILRYRTLRHNQSLTSGDDLMKWEELALVKRTVEDEMQRVEADFDLAVAVNPSASVLRQGPMPNMSFSTPASSSMRAGTGSTSPEPTSSPLPPGGAMSMPTMMMGIRSPPTPPQFQPGKLSRVSLHWLTAYAAFMTTKILWSRLVRLDIRTDETSTAAVESILQIALLLRRSEGTQLHARELPSMLWPLPLFVAGIEAVDEVRADWVKLFISGVQGDRGAQNGGIKMLELLEEVRSRQDAQGRRIVVTDLMVEKGQTTDMFVF